MKEVLLAIDFQNELLHEEGKTKSFGTVEHAKKINLIENAKKALDFARKKMDIIHVRVGFKKGYPEIEGNKAPFYLAHPKFGFLEIGTWGFEPIEEMKEKENEKVFVKHRINPFTNKDFEKELSKYDRIYLTGVSTNLAIEETVRNAAAKNYEVIVIKDCCAGINEEMYNFSFEKIIPKFAKIIEVKDFIQ